MTCSHHFCDRPATRRAQMWIMGCLTTVDLCDYHAGRWTIMISMPVIMTADFSSELETLHPTPADEPPHSHPADEPSHSAPVDRPLQTRSTYNLTCDICGLPIVRRDGIWAAVFPPGQYLNEQDGRRFEILATNHEHRPG